MTAASARAERARAVRFDRYGGREVLSVRDVPMPRPGVGEVLVEVRAAGINPGEVMIRSGVLHERLPATFPSGEGTDLAGIVVETGPDVEDFSTGDAVLGFSWTRSSHASHTVVPATQLIRKPEALPWEVAGALDVAGTTASAAVRAVKPVRAMSSPCRRQPAGSARWSCNCWCGRGRRCSGSRHLRAPSG